MRNKNTKNNRQLANKMKQQTPTPLTKEHLTWFIENEPNMHTGNLHVYEHGLSYPEEDKVLFAKHSAVRSAVEWLKEQMLIRYYQFEEMPNSIIKESHMREIDSINELVDEAFIVFVDDSHSQPKIVKAGLQSNQLPQHGVLAGELSLSGQEKSVDALSDVKHATRKGNPYERFDCGHMQCTECEFHCNPDDFIVRESTERVFDECFEEAINNSLSQQPDQEVENLNIPLGKGDSWKDSASLSHSIPTGRQGTSLHSDAVETSPPLCLETNEKMGAATESVANKEHVPSMGEDGSERTSGSDSLGTGSACKENSPVPNQDLPVQIGNVPSQSYSALSVGAETPVCRTCKTKDYKILPQHVDCIRCITGHHVKEETPNCICEWSCHNMRLQECPKYCVCSCHKEVQK